MKYEEIIKRYLPLLVLAVVVLLVVYAISAKQQNNVLVQTNPTIVDPNKVNIQEIDKNQLPDKFPANIPIEENAEIVHNLNATAPDGSYQATRAFETNKTLTENFTLYKNYLAAEGYEVVDIVDTPNYKMVMGSLNNDILRISLDDNTKSHTKTITISFTEKAVK